MGCNLKRIAGPKDILDANMRNVKPQDVIVDATIRALAQSGMAGTTIEAVAAEAGMSKGGVLHYFPNKQTLLLEAIQKFENDVMETRKTLLLSPSKIAGSTSASMVLALKQCAVDSILTEYYSGIALFGEPIYRNAIGAMKSRFYGIIASGTPYPEMAAFITHVIDGMWMNKLFRLDSVGEELERRYQHLFMALLERLANSENLPELPPGGNHPMSLKSLKGRTTARASHRRTTRDAVLDAAESVMTRRGLANTSLAAVATEAGISKGGLLHYFPSKRVLTTMALRRFEERVFLRRAAIIATLPDTPCRLSRATFMAISELRRISSSSLYYRIDIMEDLGYRKLIGGVKDRLYADLLKGAPQPEKILLAIFVIDGMWMNKLFSPPLVPVRATGKVQKWLSEYLEVQYRNFS